MVKIQEDFLRVETLKLLYTLAECIVFSQEN